MTFQWVLCLPDTFEFPPCCHRSLWDTETQRSSKQKASQQQPDYFSSSHASHQYEPRSRRETKARPVSKKCAIRTSTASLRGSCNENVALVGQRSYRTAMQQQPIGV